MALDWTWARAGEIGGISIGITFLILTLLFVIMWLIGLVMKKTATTKANISDKKKGE